MGLKPISTEYLSTGANRQTAVADWSSDGLVAFGADNNVALWEPTVGPLGQSSQHGPQIRAVISDVLALDIGRAPQGYHQVVEWPQGDCKGRLVSPNS